MVEKPQRGGKRKGAACVYLETWHADIEAFLELRENTGDDARRAHHQPELRRGLGGTAPTGPYMCSVTDCSQVCLVANGCATTGNTQCC